MVTSGLRIGTPALAARGFGAEQFTEVADIIALALRPHISPEQAADLRRGVEKLAQAHPLYAHLST